MSNKYGYADMLKVAAAMSVNLDNMSHAVEGFTAAADVYSGQITDDVSEEAVRIAAELREQIEKTKTILAGMNEALNAGSAMLANTEMTRSRNIGGI